MESTNSIEGLKSQYRILEQGNALWDVSNGIAVIIFMLIIFSLILTFITSLSNVAKIRRNWPQYRCNPSIMPFATLYGFDAAENFQFCMGKVFEEHSGDYTSSFTTMLRGLTGVLGTLLGSLNSMRLSIATMGGGINVIFQEFTDRIRQFFFRVRVSAITIKQLMYRLYATFFAVIYMGLSALTGMQSLSNTVLFKFLDTFCFSPDTLIEVQDKGFIPIKSVKIGDVLLPGKETVTATFEFLADGQPMVLIPRQDKSGSAYIHVSTNHYIRWNGKWIQSRDYPEAVLYTPWSGGKHLPLICLNTDSHTITFNDLLIFSDYDETAIGDNETMENLQNIVNNTATGAAAQSANLSNISYEFSEYSPTISPETKICLKNGEKISACNISIGQKLSTNYRVVGIVKKQITEYCELEKSVISASTLLWRHSTLSWQRAGEIFPIKRFSTPQIFIGIFVESSSQIELADGNYIRDYLEVFSPDSEEVYTRYLNSEFYEA